MRVEEIIAELFEIPIESIDDNSGPVNIADWDSTKHIEIIIACEKAFNFRFAGPDIPLLTSVGKIKQILSQANKNV